jgi:phospholipid/cholesterol/gamma-HCH transport system substrate-binding protein
MKATTTPRLRYVNEMVGLMFISAIVIFMVAVLGSGRVREWLDPGERLKVILPADGLFGLSEGADVEILGTKAGEVIHIVIDPDEQMFAEVQIQNGMEQFVRRDSTATIRKRYGVAGAAYLEIDRGKGEPLDWDYAVITAIADRAPTDTLAALIDEVQKRILPVIDDSHKAIRALATVADGLKDPEGDLNEMLSNLNDITGSIARGEGAVGRLMTREELADNLETMLAELNQMVQQIQPILDSLGGTARNISDLSGKISSEADQLPELSETVQRLLTSLNAVVEDLGRTAPELPRITRNISDATANLPVLLVQTQQVLIDVQQLLRQLQSHWLLGGSSRNAAIPAGRIPPKEVRP